MSQFYKGVTAGDLPPSVPLEFVTDDGTAVPAANTLNLLARDTQEDNENGIRTTADPDNGDNLYIELTNRLTNTTTVNGAVTGDLLTFDLGGDPAVYRFWFQVTSRDLDTGDGMGYTVFGSIRTDGAAATVIDTAFTDSDEDTTLEPAQISFIASGNNMILQVTGVAGQSIIYRALGEYIVI